MKEEHDVPYKTYPPHKDKIKEISPSRWNHTIRYCKPFSGYCYSCNGYGHKTVDYNPQTLKRNPQTLCVKNVSMEIKQR